MRITADFYETMNLMDNQKEKIVVLDGRNGRVLETHTMFDFGGEYNQLIEFAIDVAEDMTNDTFYEGSDTEIGYTCMNNISYFVVHVSSYPHNMYVCFPVYFNVMANPVGEDIEKTWGFKDIVPLSIRGKLGESRKPRGRMLRESAEDNEFVGNQGFTVGEFKRAWKQLEDNIHNDPEYGSTRSYDYSIYVYDVNGAQIYDEIQCDGYSDALDTLSKYEEDDFLIEAYAYGKDGECVSFEHGIDIRNGKINGVY